MPPTPRHRVPTTKGLLPNGKRFGEYGRQFNLPYANKTAADSSAAVLFDSELDLLLESSLGGGKNRSPLRVTSLIGGKREI